VGFLVRTKSQGLIAAALLAVSAGALAQGSYTPAQMAEYIFGAPVKLVRLRVKPR
jgi:hypothetical protein